MNNEGNISLGFTKDAVPKGTHMCLVYQKEEERIDTLLKYMLAGIQNNEKVACFSENLDEESVRKFFKDNNLSYDETKASNAISISKTGDVYFKNGEFNPEIMLETLKKYYLESRDSGSNGSRVIGEMTPEIENVPGGDRLLEYESRVTLLLREYPVTSICQYNANEFDGATIMNILKVHPQMIVNGSVIKNPFFIPPEKYLGI